MTDEENAILDLLGEAFNRFRVLPSLHTQDLPEFMQAIHAAQNIVLAREGLRSNGYGFVLQDDRDNYPPYQRIIQANNDHGR